jgi:hypothetical protein
MMATGWRGALPKSMLDTFLELDNFYGRMEAKHMKDKADREKKR